LYFFCLFSFKRCCSTTPKWRSVIPFLLTAHAVCWFHSAILYICHTFSIYMYCKRKIFIAFIKLNIFNVKMKFLEYIPTNYPFHQDVVQLFSKKREEEFSFI
jgi:hypothetical protein